MPALAVITIFAAFLRFYRITEIPAGFHGDEGVLGMLAQQIWHEGYIGPYSGLGGGHPTGPDYLYALPVHLLGHSMLAVRLAPALMAVFTIPLFYFFLRRNWNFARPEPIIALLGAFLLATLNWHIHFSRIGFPLVMWPFFVILAAAVLLEAMRRRQIIWWILAGAAAGIGLLMYNAHALFLAVTGLFFLAWVISQRDVPGRRRVLWMMLWLGAIIIAAMPLILYALNPDNGYFTHFRRDSLFNDGAWQAISAAGGWATKGGFLLDRYLDFWVMAVWRPHMTDTIDATGVTPIIRPVLFLLCVTGAVFGWKQRKSPLVFLGLLTILLMPLGYVTTTGGMARRSFAAMPFIVMFAAAGVVEVLRWVRARRANFFKPATVIAIVLTGFVAAQNLHDYFVKVAHSPEMSWVYTEEFTKATQFMRDLPPGTYVYFLAERWTINYETRQFLAPNVQGEDRSREFGQLHFEIDPSRGQPVFVLVGNYKPMVSELQSRYPSGRVEAGTGLFRAPHEPAFYAFYP